MGCFPLHCLAPSLTSRRKTIIKIVSADGRCLKLQAPLTVKEVLVDYPGHALFFINPSISTAGSYCRSTSDGAAYSKLSNSRVARPLPDTQSLQPGQLYFLVPLQTQSQHRSNAPSFITTTPVLQYKQTSSSSSTPTEQPIDKPPAPPSKMHRRVSFAPLPANPANIASTSEDEGTATEGEEEEGAVVTEEKRDSAAVHNPTYSQTIEAALARKPSLELLPPNSSNGASAAGVRLRMVVSKRQLEAMLAGSGKDATALAEALLNPLIKQATMAATSSDVASSWTKAVNAQKHTSYSLSSSSSSSSSSWRPAMHCIPESPQVVEAETMS